MLLDLMISKKSRLIKNTLKILLEKNSNQFKKTIKGQFYMTIFITMKSIKFTNLIKQIIEKKNLLEPNIEWKMSKNIILQEILFKNILKNEKNLKVWKEAIPFKIIIQK